MRAKVIEAATIDEVVERILKELREDPDTSRSLSSRNNVVYFDGWDGLGASAVLRAVARRLVPGAPEALAGLHFDQVVDIDCSKWESRRALQRVIAEQLNVPAWVMKILDRQDEEDDYYGVAQESRAELPQVVREMYQHIQKLNRRFLVVFHNGSGDEIDLASFCGFPLSGYSTNKVLWTFQGRFRLYPRLKVDMALNKSTPQGATDVFLSAAATGNEEHYWSYLVNQEAADLVAAARKGNIGHGDTIQLQQGQGNIDNDDEDDGPWCAADALQREMRLDMDYWQHRNLQSLPDRTASMPYWTSPPYEALLSPIGDMFPQFDKLGVLKLSRSTFSFSSHASFSCHYNIRVLWLDHCKDLQVLSMDGSSGKEEDVRRCFRRLWVLDVCYTRCDRILSAHMLHLMTQLRELNVVGAQDLDMGQLQGRLPNIRKLRVTKSTIGCRSCSENNLILLGMDKMELLNFSGNHTTMPGVAKISEMSTSNTCLETVIIIDGCVGIQKFSFKGCAKLKYLLLSGLFEDLRILDLSGTAVKTLDVSEMTARNLDELFLDGCEKLCAILWPPEDKRKSYLQKLYIDTTESAAASLLAPGKDEKSVEGGSTTNNVRRTPSASLSEAHGGRAPSEFNWCIWVRDARLLRSLGPFESYFNNHYVHMEISSPAMALGYACKDDDKADSSSRRSIKQGKDNSAYTDVVDSFEDRMLLQASQGDGDEPTLTGIYSCPHMPSLDASNCYMHMQDHGQLRRTETPQEGEETSTTITIPDMICWKARILHVHDSLSITSIPGPAPMLSSTWHYLRWCRVERCPNLECVFTTPQLQGSSDKFIFYFLNALWASQLPKARYIWNWSTAVAFDLGSRSFEDLWLLHLDLCPRIIHVLPLAMPNVESSLCRLVTLEIVWCGNLEVVFPLYTNSADESSQHPEQSRITVEFQNLKHIHHHELPKLQGICGRWRISAPMLETVKIRGCWSLKHLPAVSSDGSKKVECDCEKEWWEKLQWDMTVNHHPSLYKPSHSRYYKKTTLRSSVLI